jgi:hypothetical protein
MNGMRDFAEHSGAKGAVTHRVHDVGHGRTLLQIERFEFFEFQRFAAHFFQRQINE